MTPPATVNRVAWITGASSGIGQALALRLAREGWKVAVTARSQDKLEEMAAQAGGGIFPYAGDVSDADAMAEIARDIEATLGPITQAVLNAGVYIPTRANAFKIEDYQKSIAVNLNGTVNGLAALVPAMMTRQAGRIAIVSSVAGYGGLPTSAAYGATKAGLTNLAASLKFDLDPYGVVIQVISPGFVDTPATAKNPFPMPFLMSVDDAVERIVKGLESDRFEITFPRRFSWILKALNMLPYGLYFPLVARATGWKDKR